MRTFSEGSYRTIGAEREWMPASLQFLDEFVSTRYQIGTERFARRVLLLGRFVDESIAAVQQDY